MNFRKDLFYLFLLLGLGIVFWGEALAPGQMFFFRDIPAEIIAKKHFWSGSSGPTLWLPYSFFGVPHAANPQSESFYFLNFIFLLFGPERGVVYDVVFHHLFFLITFYLALRKVGFREEASLIGSVGFGFGGYMISLAFIPLFLRTIAWLGLLIICLNEALKTKWLKWSLLLGLVMAAQISGGEIQLAGMSWALALGVVVFAPERSVRLRDLLKASGAIALGLVGCVIMNLPQITLASELIPLSNRAGESILEEAVFWSLVPSQLGSLLIPNYILPSTKGAYWLLGFFYGFQLFMSHYLGITLLVLMILSFLSPDRLRVLSWLILSSFGLVMILGDSLGVYTFLYRYLPGFDLFRSPEKFFLFLNFGFVLLAVYGYEFVLGRKWFVPSGSIVCLLLVGLAIVFLLAYPLRIEEFGNNLQAATEYLFQRNILRVSVFFLIGLGLILLIGKVRATWVGLGLVLVLFLDLFFAHHRLNPVKTYDYFQPNAFVRELLVKEKNRIVPLRIFSVMPSNEDILQTPMNMNSKEYIEYLSKYSPNGGWFVYFGLNDIWWTSGTFYPIEFKKFQKLINQNQLAGNDLNLILARFGVEYIYYFDRGFIKVPDAFPRAMIFYQAQEIPRQNEIIRLWSTPDFSADQVLLVEVGPGQAGAGPASLKSEPARIVEYQNETVVVEAEAKKAGWLLLLDSYYPGWKAEVDGNPAEVFRADGFFRTVKIPAGKHQIVFNFAPTFLKKSFWISGVGFLIWLGLIIAARTYGKEKEKTI
jgi:hypothetical protein